MKSLITTGDGTAELVEVADPVAATGELLVAPIAAGICGTDLEIISGDGDPVDVLVITPVPLIPGVVVPCRAIGILKMEDEAGEDGKVLAVPTDKILSIYTQWQKPEDLNPLRLKTIAHFFEHYKDLEVGKWVKILGWEGPEAAKKEILDGIANYQKEQA